MSPYSVCQACEITTTGYNFAIVEMANRELREGANMLITTTNRVEGKQIQKYHGIVVGEAILGANIFKDIFASVRDVVGGRSGAYEGEISKAREIALEKVQAEAEKMGVNALVGIDIDYETVGKNGSMMMVAAAGTAVTLL